MKHFLENNLAENFNEHSNAILTLEEPEAHLHPLGVRTLASILKNMEGQRLVTTHSGDLLSKIRLEDIRRLYKEGNETRVGKIPPDLLEPKERKHIEYHIKAFKGGWLFSQCWLLVEGQTEFWTLPALAEILDIFPEEVGFSIVEYSQGGGPVPFIKVANALGIEWFVLADGDHQGNHYVREAESQLQQAELPTNRVLQLDTKDIEHLFWDSGFSSSFIDKLEPQQLNHVQQFQNNPDRYKKETIKAAIKNVGKPAMALEIIDLVKDGGRSNIPQPIIDVITKVTELANR